MQEEAKPLSDIAQLCGITERTLKDWIREEGFYVAEFSNARYTSLIPRSLERRIVRKHLPELVARFERLLQIASS